MNNACDDPVKAVVVERGASVPRSHKKDIGDTNKEMLNTRVRTSDASAVTMVVVRSTALWKTKLACELCPLV